MKIACVGEAMVELSLGTDSTAMGFAGDTLNTAIYLKRCAGDTLDVAYVTRLGEDVLSDRMVAMIEGEGIDASRISRDPVRIPGLYAISTDADGERSFLYWRDASAAKAMFDRGFKALEGFDVVYLSAITLAILPPVVCQELLSWLEAHSIRVAFDSNYRPRLWKDQKTAQEVIGRAWKIADIALPSVDDEQALFGEDDQASVEARFASYDIKGALKCGPSGPVSLPDLTKGQYQPAARVVDTTAAGDSFNGGFLAEYLRSEDLSAALQAGHDCAAKVVAHRGAIIARDHF